MASHEPDPLLRRFARNTAILCAVAVVAAIAIQRGRPEGALGVLVGTGLMAFSYKVIRDSVDARASRARAQQSGVGAEDKAGLLTHAWMLTKYVTRYGVLAVVAWAALVLLHASPIGVFVGVSLPVAAIALEAARSRR